MPIRFRTGPEIQRLKQEIESYIKRYIPDAVVKFGEDNVWIFAGQTTYPRSRRGRYMIAFNERFLEWMPRDRIFEIVNHEIAHVLADAELKERGERMSEKVSHGSTWMRHARIMGAEKTGSPAAWWNWFKIQGIEPPYPRFIFKCRVCGVKFSTEGHMRGDDRFIGEPSFHPTTHIDFWVWDARSGHSGTLRVNRRDYYGEDKLLKKIRFLE